MQTNLVCLPQMSATVFTPDVRGLRVFMAALCDLTALVTIHDTLRDEYSSRSPAMNHTSEIKASLDAVADSS